MALHVRCGGVLRARVLAVGAGPVDLPDLRDGVVVLLDVLLCGGDVGGVGERAAPVDVRRPALGDREAHVPAAAGPGRLRGGRLLGQELTRSGRGLDMGDLRVRLRGLLLAIGHVLAAGGLPLGRFGLRGVLGAGQRILGGPEDGQGQHQGHRHQQHRGSTQAADHQHGREVAGRGAAGPARGASARRKPLSVSPRAPPPSSTAAALRPPTPSMVAMVRGGSPPGPLPRPAPGGPPDGPRGSPGPPPGPGPPALADPPRGSRPAPESPWKSGSRGPPGGCPEPLPPCGCCVTCAPSIVGRTRLTLLSGGTGSVWADEPAEPKRRCSGAYAAVRLGCREIYTPHRARDVVGGGAAGRREGCSSRSSLGAPTGRVRVDSAFCTYPAAAEAADSRRFSKPSSIAVRAMSK